MFENLFDFAYVRSTRQAVGFYIAYFVLMVTFLFIAGVILALDFVEGFRVGSTIAMIYCPVLSLIIVVKKGGLGGKGTFMVLLSFIGANVGGGLIGIIPAAYLTRKLSLTDKTGAGNANEDSNGGSMLGRENHDRFGSIKVLVM